MTGKNSIPVSVSIYLIKTIWHGRTGDKIKKKHNIKCRYIPSCSEYAIMALLKYGFLRGLMMAYKRIMRCTSDVEMGTEDYP